MADEAPSPIPAAPAKPAATPVPAAPAAPVAPAAVKPEDTLLGTPAAPVVTPAPVTPTAPVAPAAVPDKYDLKLPEGSGMSDADLTGFAGFAKENALSNGQAQKVLDRTHEELGHHETRVVEGHRQTLVKQSETWTGQLKADPEFGGIGGQKFEESNQIASRTALRFFGKEFVDTVKSMGLQAYPALAKGLLKIGGLIKEDDLAAPAAGLSPPRELTPKQALEASYKT